MDLKGYKRINAALQDGEIGGATVVPKPTEGECVEYITIETEPPAVPARILNALGKAGLLEQTGPGDGGWRSGSTLKPLFGQAGSITFVDTNNRC